MLNCISIDDEPFGLEVIKLHCNKITFVNLKAEFLSALQAIEYIKEEKVDVIFLDINMPEISGLDFKQRIPDDIQIVFVTAYEEYALKSYELDVTDYLLKPVSFERFYDAALKCQRKLANSLPFETQKVNEHQQYILVKADKRLVKISINDILYIEGLKDYAKIYFETNKKLVIRESLKRIVDQLSDFGFIRVHRSYIVSMNKVSAIYGNTLLIEDQEIPVSKVHKDALLDQFTQMNILGGDKQ